MEYFQPPVDEVPCRRKTKMYEITWTVRARQIWEELSEKLQEEADRVVDEIGDDPLHKDTHELPGQPGVRQLITPSRLYLAYTQVGSLVIILDLKMFTTFLVDQK